MAWNGSNDNTQASRSTLKPRAQASSSRSPALLKGLVALLIVVVGALVAWYCLAPSDLAETDEPEQTKGLIAEVQPSAAGKVAEPEPEQPKELPPQKVGETRDGYIKLPSGRLHKVRGVITNSVSATQFKGKYEIFEHHCENEIACLLTLNPGEGLVGTPRYNGRFIKAFVESLKTPIVIGPDDSEEDRELKQNVIAAKQNLKEAMDRGEDIEKIMLDTRKEYQELARYKMELMGAINEYKKGEGVTDEDVEDYVQAANKMLEEKGIAPLNVGPITRQKLRMQLREGRQ